MVELEEVVLGVSDFVAACNQTLDYAYPSVVISGELANLRISRNRWIYFDLKDEISSVKFFGTVRQLPGPLEDGMILKVRGAPQLHHLYGFSVNVMSIQPAGEGMIRRAAKLLETKLAAEGLFDESRKRRLPYPPGRIGLVTSRQSAACADFMKILDARWQGIDIDVIDVQVQGEPAPVQIAGALEQLNEGAELPDVIVLIRGGGSPEDLAAFSSEAVTRAVATSRAPTLVAIGHEVDVSLAELAADRRASTPSNAAELLVPDRVQARQALQDCRTQLGRCVHQQLRSAHNKLEHQAVLLTTQVAAFMERARSGLTLQARLLTALNPEAVLRRGYAIVSHDGQPLQTVKGLEADAIVDVQLSDGSFHAAITDVNSRRGNEQR